ncbi:MAG: cobalt-precorrin-5B (C(1))-methyltransferase, partial [Pseudomonadota bacterium]
GDFAGGLLKYLRKHPIARLTVAGGFAKLTKLAQGAMDLHSSRSRVDMEFLAGLVPDNQKNRSLEKRILDANTALEVLELTRQNNIDLPALVAERACRTAVRALRGADISVDILVTDREGNILARHA